MGKKPAKNQAMLMWHPFCVNMAETGNNEGVFKV
jgi:hypothetical protein